MRAGHGIEHAALVRLGDGDAVGIDRRLRVDRKILDVAVGQHHPDGLGFLRGDAGGVGGGDQRAVDDAALRAARCRCRRQTPSTALRWRPARRPKSCRRRSRSPRCPCRRRCPTARPHNAPPAAPARTPPAAPATPSVSAHRPASRKAACRGKWGLGMLSLTEWSSSGRELVHLGKKRGRTTANAAFNMREPLLSARIAPFMWSPKRAETAFQTGTFRMSAGRKTLTLRAYPPIRPRFLEMDEILDPRGPRVRCALTGGDGRGFCDHVAAL